MLRYIQNANKQLPISFDNPEKILTTERPPNIDGEVTEPVTNENILVEKKSEEEAEAKLCEMIRECATETEDMVNHLINYKINDKSLAAQGLE